MCKSSELLLGVERASSACRFLTVWRNSSLGGGTWSRESANQCASQPRSDRRTNERADYAWVTFTFYQWQATQGVLFAPPAVSTATSGLSELVCGPGEELRRLSASRGAQNTKLERKQLHIIWFTTHFPNTSSVNFVLKRLFFSVVIYFPSYL